MGITLNEPVKFEFFCTELDYPKFLALFPDELPTTYAQFVSRVDQRIAERAEHVTVEKANVSYVEFIAECERRRETPNYQRLLLYAFHVWGLNNGFHASA